MRRTFSHHHRLATAALTAVVLSWHCVAHAQTTYTWNNAAGGAWTAAGNWTPTRSAPATNDILVFDGAATPSITVSNVPTQTIGVMSVINSCQLTLTATGAVNVTIAGGAGTDLTVGTGALLRLYSTPPVTGNPITLTLPTATTGIVQGTFISEAAGTGGVPHRLVPADAGSVVFTAGSTCRAYSGHMGNLFGNSGTNGVVIFQNGSVYRQFGGANPFGSAGAGRCVFQTGSLYRQETPSGLSLAGRTYANFEVDMASNVITNTGSPGAPCTMDNLTVSTGTVNLNYTINPGVLNVRNNIVVASGATLNFTPSGTATYALNFTGTVPQTILVAPGGTMWFNNLTTIDVANAAGVSLLSDVTTTGAVTLSAGNVTTGSNALRALGAGPITAGTRWVNGRLVIGVPSGGVCDFPIGDGASKAELNITLSGVSSGGTLEASTAAGDMPLAGSTLDPTRSVNRSWTVIPAGGLAFSLADVVFNYPAGDLDGGVTPGNLLVGKKDGAVWTYPAHNTGTSTQITATGMSGFSSFAIAEMAPQDLLAPMPSGCISTATPCLTVPMVWTRNDPTPARATSVTVQLSANLSLCGAQATDGGYLLPGSGGVSLFVTPLGGNQYTIDLATLGVPCGATGSGTLFNLLVSSGSSTGTGTITVLSAIARDCSNGPVPIDAGGTASVTIDQVVPAAITLSALQKKIGNSAVPAGTTDIQLSWTAPEAGATVSVYRKGFGGYPDYDEAGGATPSAPATPAAALLAGWALTPVSSSGGFDRVAARDFWYFVAFVTDACGNVSVVSNQTGGTLNYHLGDTHDGVTDCAGNDLVTTSDISYLGFNYGATGIPVAGAIECLDVGPTTDLSVDARPTTDHRIQFEDLIITAINYGQVSAPAGELLPAAATNELRLVVPALPAIGETFAVGLHLSGAGGVQGFTSQLGYDRSVVEFVGAEAGAMLFRQATRGVALSSGPGNVDVALLGVAGGLRGEGEIARAIFRVKAAGNAGIALESVEGRDAENRALSLGQPIVAASIPTHTALSGARPMPFRDVTTLEFSLAHDGPAELAIYSVQGRRIRTLESGAKAAGVHRIVWNGRDDEGRLAPAGMYYARLITAEGRFTRTLVRLQ